jgi:hypothetical protein
MVGCAPKVPAAGRVVVGTSWIGRVVAGMAVGVGVGVVAGAGGVVAAVAGAVVAGVGVVAAVAAVAGAVVAGVGVVAAVAAVLWRDAIGIPQVPQNREPTAVRCPESHRLSSFPPQLGQKMADGSPPATA